MFISLVFILLFVFIGLVNNAHQIVVDTNPSLTIEDQLESEVELKKWIQYVRPLMEIFTEEGRAGRRRRIRPAILQVQIVNSNPKRRYDYIDDDYSQDDYDDYLGLLNREQEYSYYSPPRPAPMSRYKDHGGYYGGGGCCNSKNDFSGLEGRFPLLALLALTGLLFFIIIASTTTTTAAASGRRRKYYDFNIDESVAHKIGI